jgi:hypothetical protein
MMRSVACLIFVSLRNQYVHVTSKMVMPYDRPVGLVTTCHSVLSHWLVALFESCGVAILEISLLMHLRCLLEMNG